MTTSGTGNSGNGNSSEEVSAILGSGVLSWDRSLYDAMLSYVGNTLSTFSLFALLIGIAYIYWGEHDDRKIKNKNINE